MSETPTVLFICVRNAGKSQMAAATLRQIAGNSVAVASAGTEPGDAINELSREVLEEHGADLEREAPKQLDSELLRRADRVIVLGNEAQVEPVDGMRASIERWVTDEPSERGIDGLERMRLVRDDIERHVLELFSELR
ncbi:arsenate-mycothiol transferase ArsC [Gulosibacter sp. ACHW.36C]|uniref:Low molecular weight phosphatase family protein n=1 Tax=Gulosibacter sediminis TaxID=1729695 RepID=A0ABY4MVW3_9MICO|nr:low molecular weight phosphatase family protein [Gulosibacter sediminis]UQN14565.1 low molecular weight phosphatase family protein [Gulosibacter sediminis]